MRDALLSIHIIAMALWFGGSIMMGYVNMSVMKTAPQASAGLARTETKFGMTFFMPMSIITLLSGVWLVLISDEAFGFGDPWVSFGFLTVIAAAILGPTKFMPISERMADALEAKDEAAAAAATKEIITWSMVQNLLLLASIILMVVKP